MTLGYMVVNADPNAEEQSIIEEIKNSGGVLEVYRTFGEHDFILKIGGDDLNDLYRIGNSIKGIKGIASSDIMTVIDM